MSKPLPTFKDVLSARGVIAPYLTPTPLHHYPQLDSLLGATVFVKHENYQPIGAFKVRGGINFMAHLSPEERQRGVVTASTGNHGQSVAYAAQLFGVRAVIVVPENASAVKVNAMRAYGAEVVFYGADFEKSKEHCITLEREQGLRFVSSGDEPLLISGVATHTLEILESRPDIDVILVPVGGGSGCAGACLVAKSVDPAIEVIGVAATGAPAGYLSWKTREPHTGSIQTNAAGLATGAPFMMPQLIMVRDLDDFVLVDDAEMMAAVRIYLEKAKTLAELAGAAPLAAAIKLRERLAGRRIALILSGGNTSPEELMSCLQ